jgi:UTP--glucose-1-phosphate uridylyltransferase
LVGEEPFAVLLADDLILGGQTSAMAELLEVYAERGGQIVSVMDVPLAHVSRYGILSHEERKGATCVIKKIVEKPQPEEAPSQTAVIGRYILSPQIFAFLEQQNKAVSGEIQLTDALAMTLKEGGSFTGVYLSGRRFDCGSREGMVCATLFRALQDPTLAPLVQREIEGEREGGQREAS